MNKPIWITATILGAAPLLVSVVGCGPDHARQSALSTPEVTAAQPALLTAQAGVYPALPRSGTDAPVVWRHHAQASPGSCAKSASLSRLQVTEVRADSASVYIDLVHQKSGPPADWPPRKEAPKFSVKLNSCPTKAPRSTGVVQEDSARYSSPASLTLPLTDLPDGELDITVRALGVETIVPLLKRGTSVKPLRDQDRQGYELVPGDPSIGLSPGVILPEPDCGDAS